jgi:nuclear transport factor 2 (NTF2) superfamily protein
MPSQLSPVAKCKEMVGLRHFPSPRGQETAIRELGAAEHNSNTRYPQRVLRVYTADSYWRKRAEFGSDQPEMVAFLIRNWTKELGGGLIKGLWAWSGAKITDRVVMRLDRDSHRHVDHSGLSTTANDRN